MNPAKSLCQLKSLGPKSAQMLAPAGVTEIEQLQALDSVACYAKVKQVYPPASLNLLWALESALSGQTWQEVARPHRTSFLLALDSLQTRP